MIFLRLVEDVMSLQTVPAPRRRDILTALTALMPSLLPCFIQTLRTNWQLCRAEVQLLPCRNQHIRIREKSEFSSAVLSTLSPYHTYILVYFS